MDVAATAVQLDGFAQLAGLAVVKIGRGQRDVPQRRDLEGANVPEAFRDWRYRHAETRREIAWEGAPGERQRAERINRANTQIVRGRPYADVVESPIDDI